jgi:hypothetical protein
MFYFFIVLKRILIPMKHVLCSSKPIFDENDRGNGCSAFVFICRIVKTSA